ncbi:MAG: membrane integrity-associated transporter subunit PqiC [Burkholderiales bacterium]|nr:membrane integrity-associated transporter subunit PqiC [Burkholderiales bacterium]
MTRAMIAAVLFVALAGCARSPLPTLHALAPPDVEIASTPTNGEQLRIVIVSIAVPQSVDRPQLVVETGHGRVAQLDHERWAEPLKRAIPRTLAAQLARELGGDAIVWSSPVAAPSRPDFRILLDVTRWQSTPGAETVLDALWTLRGGEVERSGRTLATTPVSGEGHAALVEAHRLGLRALSRDIAQAVRAIPRAH